MRFQTFIVTLAGLGLAAGANAQIISQYVETDAGSIPKGVEIWNNTAATFNFSNDTLIIEIGVNGGLPATVEVVDSGTLAPGEVMVIGTADIGSYLLSQGLTGVFYKVKPFTFNGDDALRLTYGGVVTDVFGSPGYDPGSAWSGNGVSTANQNIELISGLTTGSTGFTDPSMRFATQSTNPSGAGGLAGFGIPPGAVTPCSVADDPTVVNAFAGNSEVTVSFSHGACADSVLVVASINSITAMPSGNNSQYTASPIFGSGDDLGSGEFVVFNDSTAQSSFTVKGLNNGTTYYFKVYNSKGLSWSGGVEVTATPYPIPTTSDAWINEIHYDNVGTDMNEMVEIAIADTAVYHLDQFSMVLYNGSDSVAYGGSITIVDTIGTSYSMGYVIVSLSATLQNGTPDGLALVFDNSHVIQFLSYEGTLTALNGPAMGMKSTEIGVEESNSTPVGFSLQLKGAGTKYSSFRWAQPAAHSSGVVNNNQVFRDSMSYTYNGSWAPSDPSGIAAHFDSLIVVAGHASLSASTAIGQAVLLPGTTLDLKGNTLTTAGAFSLKADANGYSQVLGKVVGEARWQTHLHADVAARWFNVAIPLDTALNALQLSSGQILTLADGPAANVNIYSYDAATPDPQTLEGSWVPVNSQSAETGKAGFSLYLGSPYFGTLPITLTATGSLQDGNVTTPISPANGGWNFIGNPYPTTLDWDEVISDNPSLNVNYYIFNDDTDSVWVAYNAAAGPPPANAISRFIAPGQAYFVNANTTNEVNFENDQRTLMQAPQLYKAPKAAGVFLTVQTAALLTDYTYVGFLSGTNDTFNSRYDGIKRMNATVTVPNLYTDVAGRDFMYKFLNEQFTRKSIPVNFELPQAATGVGISAELMNIPPGWQMLLEDRLRDVVTDLARADYIFNHQPAFPENRFVLHVINSSGVGIPENYAVREIFAYVKGPSLMVNLKNYQGNNAQMHLVDLSGRVVREVVALSGGNLYTINMENLRPGVYILEVQDAGGVIYSKKIVR